MAKLKRSHNKKVVIVIPIILVILLAGFLTYSFANFKSIKTLDIIGSYFIGNSYTLSYNVANCESKTIKNGKTYGELCEPAIPDGYTFGGWYKGNTEITSSSLVYVNNDVTLEANLIPKDVVITFDYNGKKNYINQTSFIKSGFSNSTNDCLQLGDFDTANLNLDDDYRFTFTNYSHYLTYDDTKQHEMDYQIYGKQTTWNAGFAAGTFHPTSDILNITLNKKYSDFRDYANNTGYKIQLRTDYYTGGFNITSDATLKRVTKKTYTKKYNNAIGTLPVISEVDNVFDGWWTDPSGGTKISSSTLVPLNNTTYYAHWIEKPSVDFRVETVNNVKYIALDVFSPDIAVSSVTSNNGLTSTNMAKNLKIYMSCVNESNCTSMKSYLVSNGYSNVTENQTAYPSAADLKSGGYNVYINYRNYAAANAINSTYFSNGINVVTQGNDSSSDLDIISNQTNVAATLTAQQRLGLTFRAKNSNFYRRIGNTLSSVSNYDDDSRYVIKFNSNVEVLYKEFYNNQVYDSMGYYNSNGTKWFHYQNRVYMDRFIKTALDYIASKNVYYFRVTNTGTYTFTVKDANNNSYTYTYNYQ